MARHVITDELAAKVASLRKNGQSFRSIGAALGIDPRTAKGAAERVATGGRQDHWETVERQLDIRYLDEHFGLLLYAAAGVLRAVQTHPRDTGIAVESEVWLTHQIGSSLLQARDLLLERGIVRESGLDGDVEIPLYISQQLIGGLKEHEPELAVALDGPGGWTERCGRFQGAQQELIEQALGLLNQHGSEGAAADSVAEAAVRVLVLQEKRELFGVPTLGEPVPDMPETADYRLVFDQISQLGRLEDLRESGARVVEAATRVEQSVIELQLRGRPGGRCSLCPSNGGD